MHWSIRTKIFAVLSSLLLTAIFAYLVLANRVFREDKELLVFDTNRSNTARLTSEFDSSLRRVLDKTKIIAKLLVNSSERTLVNSFFEEDDEILAFALISVKDGKPKMVHELLDRRHMAESKISVESMRLAATIDDLDGALKNLHPQKLLVENRSISGIPLFRIRIPIELKGGEKNAIVLAQVIMNASQLLDDYHNQRLAIDFATTESGVLLAHSDMKRVLEHADFTNHALWAAAKAQNLPGRQMEFDFGGKTYLGLFERVASADVIVFSMTEKNVALAAGRLLLEKTLVLSLIIITVIFIIGLWFAGSLSNPIMALAKAAGELAKGQFDTKIEVNTRDEIKVLADAFGAMAHDLKSSRIQLEDYSRSLEAKVQERTRELANKNVAIREQQEVLLKTTRLAAVGEVAGVAAHEVLNPLTGMIARLEGMAVRLEDISTSDGAALTTLAAIINAWRPLLEKGGVEAWIEAERKPSSINSSQSLLEEDVNNLIAICKEIDSFGKQLKGDLIQLSSEAFRISRIVDGMRGLSRASGIKRLADISSLALECVSSSEDLLHRYKIQITTNFLATSLVLIDRDEMRQVFLNLIKNSMDAIEQRRRQEMSTNAEPSPGLIEISSSDVDLSVVIKIRDNGIGISPQDSEKIFEQNFSTKGAAGTGFGLGICRRFIRAAGGDISVRDSAPGKFTEFEITIPKSQNQGDVNGEIHG